MALPEGKNEVTIDFAYLDQNEGALFQVIHSGQSSKDLILRGTIIEVKSLNQVLSDETPRVAPLVALIISGLALGSWGLNDLPEHHVASDSFLTASANISVIDLLNLCQCPRLPGVTGVLSVPGVTTGGSLRLTR